MLREGPQIRRVPREVGETDGGSYRKRPQRKFEDLPPHKFWVWRRRKDRCENSMYIKFTYKVGSREKIVGLSVQEICKGKSTGTR